MHRLDMALRLMGFPELVSVSGVTYDVIAPQIARAAKAKFDVQDTAAGLVRSKNGTCLIIFASWAGNTDRRTW